MDINQYEVFLEVVNAGSISGAAQTTGYTQSAVSYIIKNLEKGIGLKLVNRTRSGVSLTKNGVEIVPLIREVVSANKRLKTHVLEVSNLVKGNVVLGGSASVKIMFFLPAIEEFQKKYPEITFKFVDGNNETLDRCINEGTIDIGIFTQRNYMRHKYFFLKDDPLLAVLPPDCTEYTQGVFPFEGFSKYVFIPTSFDDEFDILEDLKKMGIFCGCPLQIEDSYTAIAAVERKLGITVLPELSIKTKKGFNVKCVGLQPPRYRRLCLFASHVNELTPAAEAFYNFCMEYLPTIAQSM